MSKYSFKKCSHRVIFLVNIATNINYDLLSLPYCLFSRLLDGHVQEFHSLCTYMKQFSPDQFLEAMSDFHLLLFIASMDIVPMKVISTRHSIRINGKIFVFADDLYRNYFLGTHGFFVGSHSNSRSAKGAGVGTFGALGNCRAVDICLLEFATSVDAQLKRHEFGRRWKQRGNRYRRTRTRAVDLWLLYLLECSGFEHVRDVQTAEVSLKVSALLAPLCHWHF